MVGAVAGTPGTLPTNWTGLATVDFLDRRIAGVGVENGITYIDVQYSGTAGPIGGNVTVLTFDSNSFIGAANGQTWTASLYTKLVAGSLNNVSLLALNIRYSTSGGLLVTNQNVAFTPSASFARTINTFTAVNTPSDTIAFVNATLVANFANSQPVDFTLRIGLPQLENNNISTGVASATVSAGGTGYAIGDILQIVGGTGTAARVTVATLSGSAVATVTVSTAGSYSVFPSPQPVSVTAITGTGSSATFNIVPQAQTGFATSYIPTTTTALTRAADVASVNTLSPWYNASAGTLFAEFALTQPASGGNQFLARFSDNSYNNSIADNVIATGFAQLATASGGVFDGTASTAGVVSANTTTKFAGAYAANDLAACKDGGTVAVDPSATIPSGLTRFDLGSDHAGANRVKAGYLRRISYWPRRLANAELQSITS
jgi:hypothetical protein